LIRELKRIWLFAWASNADGSKAGPESPACQFAGLAPVKLA